MLSDSRSLSPSLEQKFQIGWLSENWIYKSSIKNPNWVALAVTIVQAPPTHLVFQICYNKSNLPFRSYLYKFSWSTLSQDIITWNFVSLTDAPDTFPQREVVPPEFQTAGDSTQAAQEKRTEAQQTESIRSQGKHL